MSDVDKIISSINSIFGTGHKPVESSVVFSNYWNGQQWAQNPYKDAETNIVGHFLSNKTWQELTHLLGQWYEGRSCLSFLTAEGMAYYLPAYMLFILKETKHELWADFLQTTLFHLTPPKLDPEQYKKYGVSLPADAVIEHQLSEYDKFISLLR